ncbi:asparaginase [Corynebacterium sp. TAE3-ERU12]|uniref:asparaginase n=1 Tax=Corynebacterium sp. TAE3-ERU12 TaxID=2849491 RepID=UPI001C47639E|nr:asparaginase [Corynebacterium sp. TAE3-ERU12]MBV7296209.1 asparaginase [Corynebacterium sp. TAE3-ERU12]
MSTPPLAAAHRPRIAVLATGGTIASTANDAGQLSPTRSGAELVAGFSDTYACVVTEVGSLDSSALSLSDVDAIAAATREALADPSVAGVVVTHGTDTLAETAIAVDLQHLDERPVVFVGAQRPADDAHPDGPANLATALAAAADRNNRGRGVLIAFAGELLPAFGTTKQHTTADQPFMPSPAQRPAPIGPVRLEGVRVDIVTAYPGCDGVLADAAIDAGADGVVIAGVGSGNCGPGLATAIYRACRAGIPVVLSTQVCQGPTAATYGGVGGGATLAELGVLTSGYLRPGQARMVLATAIAADKPATALFAHR